MSRSQKKSFVASTGLHLSLLLVVLLVSSAFQSSKQKSLETPPIDFVPVLTTDDDRSGGGTRNAPPSPVTPEIKPPAPAAAPAAAPVPAPVQPTPPPVPAPPKVVPPTPKVLETPIEPKVVEPKVVHYKVPKPEPEPVTEAVRPARAKPVADSLEPPPRPAAKKPKIDLSEIVTRANPAEEEKRQRKVAERLRQQQREQREQEEQEAADRETERQIRNAAEARRAKALGLLADAQQLTHGLPSSHTAVTLEGPGDGGVPYGNFLSGVQRVYERDWRPRVPRGVTEMEVSAMASVTIGRDGTVLEAKLSRSSGNHEVDESVVATLQNVRQAVPLPERAKESQRTITIEFNVKPKHSIG